MPGIIAVSKRNVNALKPMRSPLRQRCAIAVLPSSDLAPSEPNEAAILTTLEPGDYQGIVQDQFGGSGIGLLEIFKAGGSGQLVEFSSQGRVLGGHGNLVGGFIADEVMTVLITAVGPSLEDEGVADALQNPVLELRNGYRSGLRSGWRVIAVNDNWEDSEHADYLREEGLAPADPREAAIVTTIRPWGRGWSWGRNYTATVISADGVSGVSQIKIQKLFE